MSDVPGSSGRAGYHTVPRRTSGPAVDRESHLVELVDRSGAAIGECTVDSAHTSPGRLHRAFSALLMDPDDRLLLQRRAAVKTRFPLRWANACCGHPAPGSDLPAAANDRLGEELGVAPVPLRPLGVHLYRATDPVTGRVEYEYDHVLLGRVPHELPVAPDPAEVAEVRWVPVPALAADMATHPDRYAPWLSGVIALLPGYRS